MRPDTTFPHTLEFWGAGDKYNDEYVRDRFGVLTDLRKNLLLLFTYAYEDLIV